MAASLQVRRVPRFRVLLPATVALLVLVGCSVSPGGASPRISSAPPVDVMRPTAGPTQSAGGEPIPSASAADGWRPVWSDEFDGTSVDRSRWTVRHFSTFGDGNLELACLMDRPENVRVADGVLTITARREQHPLRCGTTDPRFPAGRSFTTGFLESRGAAEFEYGRFEVRARLPLAGGTSRGLWPAFWLRPANMGIGEIDVFEGLGGGADEPDSARRVIHAIHYDYDGTHPMQSRSRRLETGSFAEDFHTFALEWEPGSLRWYVDDRLSYERTLTTTPWLDEAFQGPFFLRLNLAVGGTFPGDPDDDTEFPADYVVDSVRVYQR